MAPRPFMQRSSMIAVPSAFWSILVAGGDLHHATGPHFPLERAHRFRLSVRTARRQAGHGDRACFGNGAIARRSRWRFSRESRR